MLAALCNDFVYLNADSRRVLQGQLSEQQLWLYTNRCTHLAKRKKEFNPACVTESLADEATTEPVQSPELVAAVARNAEMNQRLGQLHQKLDSLRQAAIWGVIALIGAMVVLTS